MARFYRRYVRRRSIPRYRRARTVVRTTRVIRGRGKYTSGAARPARRVSAKGTAFGTAAGKALGSASTALGVPAPLAGVLGDLAGKGLGWLGGKIGGLLGMGKYMRANSFLKKVPMGTGVPYMHSASGDRGLRVRRREMMTELKMPINPPAPNTYGDLTVFGGWGAITPSPLPDPGPKWNPEGVIHPTNRKMFPWLTNIAAQFQEWKLLGCGFFVKTYIPNSVISAVGSNNGLPQIYMGVKFNTNLVNQRTPIFTSFADMLNTQYTSVGKGSEDLMLLIECDPRQNPQEVYFIDQSFLGLEGDRRFLDHAIIQIGVSNPNLLPTAGDQFNFGQLFCFYDIALMKPLITAGGVVDPPSTYIFDGDSTAIFSTPDADDNSEPAFLVTPAFMKMSFGSRIIRFNEDYPGRVYDITVTYQNTVAGGVAFNPATLIPTACSFVKMFFDPRHVVGAADTHVAHVSYPRNGQAAGNLRVVQRFCVQTNGPDASIEFDTDHAGWPGGSDPPIVTVTAVVLPPVGTAELYEVTSDTGSGTTIAV